MNKYLKNPKVYLYKTQLKNTFMPGCIKCLMNQ